MRKILIGSLLIIVLFLETTAPSYAVTLNGVLPDSTNYGARQQSDFILQGIMNSTGCEIGGTSLIPGEACPVPTTSGLKLFSKVPGGGALGMIDNTTLALYNNPSVHVGTYLARVESNFTAGQTVYAASGPSVTGSGADVLSMVLTLWEGARNFAYLLFTLVFIVVGFMIMFRKRINPQTVVTVQLALPRLVIGLILVTFSYLIAALIVDLSILGAGFVGGFFKTLYPNDIGTGAVLESTNIFNLMFNFLFRTGVLTSTIQGVWGSLVTPVTGANLFTGGFWSIITKVLSAPLTLLTGGVISILFPFIIIIAALIQALRLLWALIMAYVTIFVFTILGPIFILISSLPGQEGLFAFWLKSLLANALVFPAVYAAFLFAAVILESTGGSTAALPLFGGLDPNLLKSILAVGIILGTPAIPNMIKDSLKIKDIQGIPQEAMRGASNAGTVVRGVAEGGLTAAGIRI